MPRWLMIEEYRVLVSGPSHDPKAFGVIRKALARDQFLIRLRGAVRRLVSDSPLRRVRKVG